MLKLYSEKSAERIIARLGPEIDAVEARCGLPGAYLRAVLYMEITGIDVLDPAADALARFNQRRGRGRRRDSSTGYAQIFAAVAIRAVNFAADRGIMDYVNLGLPEGQRLDPDSTEDLRFIWGRLHRDVSFNLLCAGLNLLSAAEEMTGRIDFASYSPEETKLILTRYNGNFREVSPYGEAAYRAYLRYTAG